MERNEIVRSLNIMRNTQFLEQSITMQTFSWLSLSDESWEGHNKADMLCKYDWTIRDLTLRHIADPVEISLRKYWLD